MSNLQAQDLYQAKALKLLTTQETSLIVGGSTLKIDNSFEDFVDAGPDDDLVITGPSNDTVIGGAGSDMLFGGSGADVLIGDYR